MDFKNKYFLGFLILVIIILIYKHIQFYNFYNKSLKLWDDHFYWTRLFIVLSLRNAVGLPETTTRLLQNAVDFGNLYGSKKLEVLITEHLTIAAGIVESVKKTGKPDENLIAQWHENALKCGSEFYELGGIYNKIFHSETDLKSYQDMMLEHLTLTSGELMAEYACVSSSDHTLSNIKNTDTSSCQKSINDGDNALHEIRMMAKFFTPY